MVAWARKYSLFAYPFATACCSQEYAVASPRFDLARFGAEAARFSPRQADLLWIVGTISQRQTHVLKRIYEQMMERSGSWPYRPLRDLSRIAENWANSSVNAYVPAPPPTTPARARATPWTPLAADNRVDVSATHAAQSVTTFVGKP